MLFWIKNLMKFELKIHLNFENVQKKYFKLSKTNFFTLGFPFFKKSTASFIDATSVRYMYKSKHVSQAFR